MSSPLHLFEATGVELEYMIIRRDTMDVLPIADEVMKVVTGEYLSDYEDGPIAWSNELVLHVIELKTNGPAATLDGLSGQFQQNVQRVNEILGPMGAMLLPTAMHPWMDPATEMRLWPHEYNETYDSYNRIFDCRGHGWSNMQSTHINLPFANDEEFGRLHAAIRLVLPLLPGLAASSPIVDGQVTGMADTRLSFYRKNQARVPSIAGKIIPEPVFNRADYDREIFQRCFRDIAPFDPEGILQKEFLNSRGAIARFSRGAIEIRLIDIQECPQADVALVALVNSVVRELAEGRTSDPAAQRLADTDRLALVLDAAILSGDAAIIEDDELLRLLGINARAISLREVWLSLGERTAAGRAALAGGLRAWRDGGTLSLRIVRATGPHPARDGIARVYRRLAECLQEGTLFIP